MGKKIGKIFSRSKASLKIDDEAKNKNGSVKKDSTLAKDSKESAKIPSITSSLDSTRTHSTLSSTNSPDENYSNQELLEGCMNLLVNVNQTSVVFPVERNVPLLDVLALIAKKYHFNPANYTIEASEQVSSRTKQMLENKSNPIGLIGTDKFCIVPKPVSKKDCQKEKPFEQTICLKINLPHGQLSAKRLPLSTRFHVVKAMICEEKSWDPKNYILVQAFISDQAPITVIDLDKSIGDYKVKEVTFLTRKKYDELCKQFTSNNQFRSSICINDDDSNRLGQQNDWCRSTPNIFNGNMKQKQSDTCSLASSRGSTPAGCRSYKKKPAPPPPPTMLSTNGQKLQTTKSVQNLSVIRDENEDDLSSNVTSPSTPTEIYSNRKSSGIKKSTSEVIKTQPSSANGNNIPRPHLSRKNSDSDSSGYHEMLADTPTDSNSPAPPVSPNPPSDLDVASEASGLSTKPNAGDEPLKLVKEKPIPSMRHSVLTAEPNTTTATPVVNLVRSNSSFNSGSQSQKKRRAPLPPSMVRSNDQQQIRSSQTEQFDSLSQRVESPCTETSEEMIPISLSSSSELSYHSAASDFFNGAKSGCNSPVIIVTKEGTKQNDEETKLDKDDAKQNNERLSDTSIDGDTRIDSEKRPNQKELFSLKPKIAQLPPRSPPRQKKSKERTIIAEVHHQEDEQTEKSVISSMDSVEQSNVQTQVPNDNKMVKTTELNIDDNKSIKMNETSQTEPEPSDDDKSNDTIVFQHKNDDIQPINETQTDEQNEQCQTTSTIMDEQQLTNKSDAPITPIDQQNEAETIVPTLAKDSGTSTDIIGNDNDKPRPQVDVEQGLTTTTKPSADINGIKVLSTTTSEQKHQPEGTEKYLNSIDHSRSNNIDKHDHDQQQKRPPVFGDHVDPVSLPVDLEPDYDDYNNDNVELDANMMRNVKNIAKSAESPGAIVTISEWGQRQKQQPINTANGSINLEPSTTNRSIKQSNNPVVLDKNIEKQVEITLNELNETLDQCDVQMLDDDDHHQQTSTTINNVGTEKISNKQQQNAIVVSSSTTTTNKQQNGQPQHHKSATSLNMNGRTKVTINSMADNNNNSTNTGTKLSNQLSSSSFSVRDGIRKFNTINETNVSQQDLSSLRSTSTSSIASNGLKSISIIRRSSSKLSVQGHDDLQAPHVTRKLANFQIGSFKSESSVDIYSNQQQQQQQRETPNKMFNQNVQHFSNNNNKNSTIVTINCSSTKPINANIKTNGKHSNNNSIINVQPKSSNHSNNNNHQTIQINGGTGDEIKLHQKQPEQQQTSSLPQHQIINGNHQQQQQMPNHKSTTKITINRTNNNNNNNLAINNNHQTGTLITNANRNKSPSSNSNSNLPSPTSPMVAPTNFLEELKSRTLGYRQGLDYRNAINDEQQPNQPQLTTLNGNQKVHSALYERTMKSYKTIDTDQIDGSSQVVTVANGSIPPPPPPPPPPPSEPVSAPINKKVSPQTLFAPKGWNQSKQQSNGPIRSPLRSISTDNSNYNQQPPSRDALFNEIKNFHSHSKLRKVETNKPFSLKIN